MKSIEREEGEINMVYFLISYLPTPGHIEEMKTKPTQQAIRMLSETGIFPDFIICRSAKAVDMVRRKKIETYANIPLDHIIAEPDIDTIYRIPLDLEKEELGLKILKKFNLKPRQKPDFSKWKALVEKIVNPAKRVSVGIVGKYVDIGDYTLKDSYISISQAIIHAGAQLNVGVDIKWIDSKGFEKNKEKLKVLNECDGIIVPGGFGNSGVEGKIAAIGFARKHDIPFLGLCYGMQLAIVEFARDVCGMEKAHTTEVDADTAYPVIDLLPSQKKILEASQYGGTMRLGAYAAILKEHSQVLKLYKEISRLKGDQELLKQYKKDKKQAFRLGILDGAQQVIFERHRHRYEVNPALIPKIVEKGLVFSGFHERLDNTKLMEFIELPSNKFHVATQGHPEFTSRFGKPSPLFYGFVKACM
jgi:CTP synthase